MKDPSEVTSFPRKRESVDMGPRFRGGDGICGYQASG